MKYIVTGLVSAMMLAGAVNEVSAAITGNLGVVSSYNLRGITNAPESDTPAVQGGFDYTNSGFYAGYWFSTLSYSYTTLNNTDLDADGILDNNEADDTKKSVEHDLYGGYNGTVGDLGYTVGGTIYYYAPGWESTGYETKLGLSYKGASLTAQTLLNDVTFGTTGDTYWLASYSYALPKDFTASAGLGFFTYGKKGDFVPATNNDGDEEKSAGFRHLILGVSHPLAATGGILGLQYIIGGDDRYGVGQDDKVVASLGFTF